MLEVRTIALGIALLLAMVAVSSAQPQPSPNSNPPNSPAVQPSAADQRGTDQSPLTVKVLPDSDAQQKAKNEERERREKAEIDKRLADETQRLADYTDSLARFTWFLVIIAGLQALLFGVQLGFMRSGLRDTRITAEAGKLQADSLIASQRPYIYPDPPDTSEFLPSGANAVYPTSARVPVPNVQIVFLNVGQSHGVVKEIRVEIVLDRLPAQPDFTYAPVRRGEIIVRPDTQSTPFKFEFDRNLTPAEIDEFGVGTRPFFCFGYVKYTDAFDRLHTKGFCFTITLHKGPIELSGGGTFNYSRSEKTPDAYAT